MKIMMLVRSLHIGGKEKMVIELASELSRRGHELEITCIEEAGPLAADAEQQGLVVYSLDKGLGLKPKFIAKLRRRIKAGGFDLVHSHNPLAHFYGSLAAAGTGAKLIHTSHQICKPAHWREFSYAWLATRLSRRVVGVSKAASDSFKSRLGLKDDKSATIMNGLNLKNYVALPLSQVEAGAELVVGTVGRLAAVKNQTMMIEGVAQLREAGTPVRLRLVGDGESRDELVQLADKLAVTDAVDFVGFRDDIAKQLGQLHVFTLTSHHEGMPLSLIEAMAAGRGIVVTDVGGMPEMIGQDREGLRVAAGDVQGFVQALKSLTTDSDLLQRLAAQARRTAEERYSVDVMANAYETIYAS